MLTLLAWVTCEQNNAYLCAEVYVLSFWNENSSERQICQIIVGRMLKLIEVYKDSTFKAIKERCKVSLHLSSEQTTLTVVFFRQDGLSRPSLW